MKLLSVAIFGMLQISNVHSFVIPAVLSLGSSRSACFSAPEATPEHAVDTEEEIRFKEEIKRLCAERNLPLEKVKNCRDLASVKNSPIKPGRILRTGRVGDATEKDKEILFDKLDITTFVDLRSPTELKDDPALMSDVFKGFTDLVWVENGRGKDGCVRELSAGVSPLDREHFRKSTKVAEDADELCDLGCDDPHSIPADQHIAKKHSRRERHFVSMMNEFKYVRGTVTKLRKRDMAKSLFKVPGAIVSKRIWNSLKRPFLKEINDGGLTMLNELLLRFGSPGLKYVLDLCATKERHPIAFYCTAGKDRTGLVAAVILGVCGAKPEDIVEDYSLSANVYAELNDHSAMVGALSQRDLDAKIFLGAPPHVMAETLLAIEESYGSVNGYCDHIGFGASQREKLRKALMED